MLIKSIFSFKKFHNYGYPEITTIFLGPEGIGYSKENLKVHHPKYVNLMFILYMIETLYSNISIILSTILLNNIFSETYFF